MEFFDYGTLKIIWWLLIGVLLVGFTVMDGHDMGVGALLPFVGKTDEERRAAINTVAPHWDGNQVWFITAGGAIFAAFPFIYATAFSGLYWAMLVVLFALFLRPVGFDYRSKMPSKRWRNNWDWALFIGSFVPPVIFGVAFGNLLQGVPFHFDDTLRSFYTGSFWALLNPFALLCGVVSSSMVIAHGGVYLTHRTEGAMQARARRFSRITIMLSLIGFTLAGVWVSTGISGYVMTSAVNPNMLPDPTTKTVVREMGAWLHNFQAKPILWMVPALAYVGFGLSFVLLKGQKTFWAFWTSAVAIIGIIGTAGVAMFPFMMPSSSNPNMSLTLWDSASSQLTLGVMLVVALIFVPIILLYTRWAYSVMRGKVTTDYVRENSHTLY